MKKIFGWIVAILVVGGIASASHSSTPTANLSTTPAATTIVQQAQSPAAPASTAPPVTESPTPTPTPAAPAPAPTESNLSNSNTYPNVDGDTVHSPAYSTDDSVSVGATAKCVDGTFSFSENHRGTCSHHGGVSEWL